MTLERAPYLSKFSRLVSSCPTKIQGPFSPHCRCHVVAMKGTWRVVAGLLVFWLVILVYMSTTLYSSSDVNERTERQLAKALQELDALKKQNEELQKLANELK